MFYIRVAPRRPAAVSLLESQVFAGRLDLRERDRPFAFDRYPAFFTFYGYFFAVTQRKRLCGRVFQNGGQFRSVFQHRLDFPPISLRYCRSIVSGDYAGLT